MSNASDEFARYAKAERTLCDEAAPLLATIIRTIEDQVGLRLTEIRVTVDWAKRSEGSISANCTVVHAYDASTSDGHRALRSHYSTEPPRVGLSPGQD